MSWERIDVEIAGAGSLAWVGGVLFDVAKGWQRLDGVQDRLVGRAPFGSFETVTVAPAADLAALVDGDGTKALLLEAGGGVVREVNRSWDCAEDFRYPLALFTLPDGQTGLVHCPNQVNRLEIEVAATGERLTRPHHRTSPDVFPGRGREGRRFEAPDRRGATPRYRAIASLSASASGTDSIAEGRDCDRLGACRRGNGPSTVVDENGLLPRRGEPFTSFDAALGRRRITGAAVFLPVPCRRSISF